MNPLYLFISNPKSFAKSHNLNDATLEQQLWGLQQSISPNIFKALGLDDPVQQRALERDYAEFRKAHRKENYGLLSTHLPEFDVESPPIKQWYISSGLTRLEMCRAFCIGWSLMTSHETYFIQRPNTPGEFMKALSQSGYPNSLWPQLKEANHAHHSFLIAKIRRLNNQTEPLLNDYLHDPL